MITLFLFISVIGGYLFVMGADESELVIMFVGLIAAISGIFALIFVLTSISKQKAVIRDELKNIDNATQSNATTIINYESTKPLINTFPDVVTKSTNFKQTSTPSSTSAPSFLMPISDTFYITGRGTVVTGTISVGTIRIGDTVQIEGQQYQVLGIEAQRQTISNASAGMAVGLLINSGNVKFNQGATVILWQDQTQIQVGTM